MRRRSCFLALVFAALSLSRVPAGFAHGFCTLERDTVVLYKVDQFYSAAHDSGINWADSKLGIEWPVAPAEAILSDKDRGLPMFADLAPVFE